MRLWSHQKQLIDLAPDKWFLAWEMGCLSHDTIIKFNRGGNGRSETIKSLHDKIKNSTRINRNIETNIQSDKGGIIGLNKMVDIWFSGIKDVYELELVNGYKIKTTKDHRFLTDKGYIKLGDIDKKHLIATNDDSGYKKQPKALYLNVNSLRFHPFACKFSMPRKDRGNRIYHHAKVEKHRLIYEANLNNISYDDYIYILRYDEITASKLKFIDPKQYHIHHKDFNHKNNNIDNLERLTPAEHHSKHKLYRNFPNTKVTFIKIKSIKYVGKEETYDIECEKPYSNFVANGFVVHNSGKSLALIELTKIKGDKALLICPKSLVEKWEEDIKLHQVDMDVISKEQFKIKHSKGLLPKYNTILVDEAHYFSGYKSALTKALADYLREHNPKHLYFATATPYLSTSYNIWTYLKLFGRNIKWFSWTQTFFTKIKMGNRLIPVERKTFKGREMSEVMGDYIRQIGNFVSLDDCFDVPEQISQRETFQITAEQKKAFELHHDITPIVNYTRRLQIENGTIKTPEGFDTFKSEKLSRVLELIKEHKKLVVVCRHRAEMELIKQNIKKPCFLIHGDVKDRNEVVKQANASEECVVLVNASCSEGYELPLFPIMVFYSLSNSHKDHIQMKGRILRANHLKKNVYLYLVVKGGVDEMVYKNVVEKKQDFHFDMINNL
jgi:hypothetical protein